MKERDFKRVVSQFIPDNNLRDRMKKNVLARTKIRQRNSFFPKLAAAICILMVIAAFSIPLLQTARKGSSARSEDAFGGFVLTAYAANSNYSTLTASFASQATATTVRPGVKIEMPCYSPLMSSVPGFPFTVGFRQTRQADTISITAEGGSLLTWNRQTGKVSDKGNQYQCAPGETFYWSPISAAKGDILLTISAVRANKEIGSQKLVIHSVDGIHYTASLQ